MSESNDWLERVRKVRYAAAELAAAYAKAADDPNETVEQKKGHAAGAGLALAATHVLVCLEEAEQDSQLNSSLNHPSTIWKRGD